LDATTGALDTGFSAAPVLSQAWGIAVQTDGRVLVGGQTVGDQSGVAGNQYYRVVRYFPNGVVDTSYHSVVTQGIGRWMTLQPDGKLLLSNGGTNVSANGGIDANSIIRLNTDGSLDTSF